MKAYRTAWLTVLIAGTFLAACGPVRKSVFPPLVSVQQLQLSPDGHWRMQLRIQNNSYEDVKFTQVRLAMKVHGVAAGRIESAIDLDIPALSVDVADVHIMPSAPAARALSDGGQEVPYELVGTVSGIPESDSKPRSFKVHSEQHWLSPMPGIPGTWR